MHRGGARGLGRGGLTLVLVPILVALGAPSGAIATTTYTAPYSDSDHWAYRYDFTVLPPLGFTLQADASADPDTGAIESSVSIQREAYAIEEPRGRAGGVMIVRHPVPEDATSLTYEAVVHVSQAGGTLATEAGLIPGTDAYYFVIAYLGAWDDECGEDCLLDVHVVEVTDNDRGAVEDETIVLSVTVDLSDGSIGDTLAVFAGLDLYVGAGSGRGVTNASAVGSVESITLL